jgi:hypothetical protein
MYKDWVVVVVAAVAVVVVVVVGGGGGEILKTVEIMHAFYTIPLGY